MTATQPPQPWAGPPPGWAPPPERSVPSGNGAEAPAGVRSQVAVYAVGALAMLIAAGAAGQPAWGAAGALALAAGVAIGLLVDLGPLFRALPGAVLAIIVGLVLATVVALLGLDPALPLVGLIAVGILGLDWRRVGRLRPLPFAFGFLVVIGVAGEQTWTYPAGLVWLALALGALTSLEADRRAAQPKVEPMTPGPASPDVRTDDLATTILIALAVALVVALLLSAPSCHHRPSNTGSQRGGNGSQVTGNGSAQGNGGSGPGGTASGQGGARPGTGSGQYPNDHQYVPDPNGRYLIPDDGSTPPRNEPGSRVPIPSDADTGTGRTTTNDPDGTVRTTDRNEQGHVRITVTDPDGTRHTYRYTPRSDGLTTIDEYDRDGNHVATYYWDPDGKVATGSRTGSSSPTTTPAEPKPKPKPKPKQKLKINGWLVLAIVTALLAITALAVWLSRRQAKPPAPPAPPVPTWALHLAKQIEHEGSTRGRPRRTSEPLVAYTRALAAGPLPDERLVAVGSIVSDALFARVEPGPEAQHWAESTLAEIVAAHPSPGRGARPREQAGSAS